MTLRERRRPGEFILSEADGFRSRTAMTIASGLMLEAGTVLQSGDDGAMAFDSGTCVGVLIGAVDTRLGSARAAVLSGEAEVIFEELVYPVTKPATTWAALKALGIIGRGIVGADTNGGGGGAPEWLPSGASLFIDTVNDHYYADGAERAKGDVLTDNSPTHYGFTALALSGWGGSAWTTVLQTDYSTDMEIGTGNNFSILGGVGGSWSFYDQNGPDSPSVPAGGGSSSRIAISATSSSYSGSAVGGSVQSGTMGSPFPGDAAATLTHFDPPADQIVLAVYPHATADADLPALSTMI